MRQVMAVPQELWEQGTVVLETAETRWRARYSLTLNPPRHTCLGQADVHLVRVPKISAVSGCNAPGRVLWTFFVCSGRDQMQAAAPVCWSPMCRRPMRGSMDRGAMAGTVDAVRC